MCKFGARDGEASARTFSRDVVDALRAREEENKDDDGDVKLWR